MSSEVQYWKVNQTSALYYMYVHCYILKCIYFYIHIARGLTVVVYIHLAFIECLGKSLVIPLSSCSNFNPWHHIYVHCYCICVHFYIHKMTCGLTVVVYIHVAFIECLGKSLVIPLSSCSNFNPWHHIYVHCYCIY